MYGRVLEKPIASRRAIFGDIAQDWYRSSINMVSCILSMLESGNRDVLSLRYCTHLRYHSLCRVNRRKVCRCWLPLYIVGHVHGNQRPQSHRTSCAAVSRVASSAAWQTETPSRSRWECSSTTPNKTFMHGWGDIRQWCIVGSV